MTEQTLPEVTPRPAPSRPDPAVPAADAAAGIAPLSSASLFWRPKYLADEPVLGHVPFLFWLAEVTRPRLIATLGLGRGTAHFALAQAAERLGLEATCCAVEAAGAPGLAAAAAYNAATYGDVSRVIVADPAGAAGRFPAGSIDILLVQLPPAQETEARIVEDWLPRLSRSGVLVLPCPEDGPEGGPLADLAATLATEDRLVEIGPPEPGGAALRVLLVGARRPERLDLLARLRFGRPGHTDVQRVFAHLGQAAVNALRAGTAAGAGGSLRDLPAPASAPPGAAAVRHDPSVEVLARAAQAELRAEAAEAGAAEAQAAREDAAEAREHLARVLAETKRLVSLVADAQDEALRATDSAEKSARRAWLAEGRIGQTEARAQRAEEALREAEARLAAMAGELASARAAGESARERVAAIEASTSWRVTSPLRAAALAVRGR